jgi:hypothetical protein
MITIIESSFTKFVPSILTADQKQQHVNVCEELRQIASNDATLSRVIIGDELNLRL